MRLVEWRTGFEQGAVEMLRRVKEEDREEIRRITTAYEGEIYKSFRRRMK